MTPALASQIAVEYSFRCFCGATIQTAEKKTTCASCGTVLGIRRVRSRRNSRTASGRIPHRSLQLDDLKVVAVRTAFYLLCGYYIYDLING